MQTAVFADHPDFTTTQAPDHPVFADMTVYAPRDGVDASTLRFDHAALGYARDARDSYDIFRRLKAEHVIPEHVRFQVSVPTPATVLSIVLVVAARAGAVRCHDGRMDGASRRAAMELLQPLVGEWRAEVTFPRTAPDAIAGQTVGGRVVFEWVLDGQFLVERAQTPQPVPDSLALIGFDPEHAAYTQHYFDSRGVARVYAMTFDRNVWTLLRETADFSPLDFSQRFTGALSDDGDTIAGRWETRTGSRWEHDFGLRYTRVR